MASPNFDVFVWLDVNQPSDTNLDYKILEYAQTLSGGDTTYTYNLFEDQVTLAGKVYTDTMLANFYSGASDKTRRIYVYAVLPIENFEASGSANDYFYPNFIPTNLWSYGDVRTAWRRPRR